MSRIMSSSQSPLVAAPFVSGEMTLRKEWIDYNGHLNMAYYAKLFDMCVDEAFSLFGLGEDYRRERNASFYTMDLRVTYLRELTIDDSVRMSMQLLDADAKRCHFHQTMRHARDGWTAAYAEQLCMHVDMNVKKASPFPDDVAERMRTMLSAHSALEKPQDAGKKIGIRRR